MPAGQPAQRHRRPRGVDGSGRIGPQAGGKGTRRVPQSVSDGARLELHVRTRAGAVRTAALFTPGQDGRRVLLDERDAVRARKSLRLRPLGVRVGRKRLELRGRTSPLQAPRAKRRAPRRLSRDRRRGLRDREALAVSALGALHRGGGGARHSPKSRLQRRAPGRSEPLPDHDEGRPAVERRRRVSSPGAQARQPGSRIGRPGSPHRDFARQGGGRGVRAPRKPTRCRGRARSGVERGLICIAPPADALGHRAGRPSAPARDRADPRHGAGGRKLARPRRRVLHLALA